MSNAHVVELEDTLVSKASTARREGSSPSMRTSMLKFGSVAERPLQLSGRQ